MRNLVFTRNYLSILMFICGLASGDGLAATQKIEVVPKWGRFEHAFKSSTAYANAVQDATLSVVLVSPQGETNQIYGFWDGAKTWRVRFSPNQPGNWTFRTICSDASNAGLHNQTGEFICGAITGEGRFQQHGPVRVARDQRHLEHADGTPFFWLADTVWNGARVSSPADWQTYSRTRSSQEFNVAQWSVAPGMDGSHQPAFTGSDRIAINPDFFKRLDSKLADLRREGIFSAIAPLMELESQNWSTPALPDDQAILLMRYVVARWGADPVAWLLAFDGDPQKKMVARWKRIGREVFAAGPHAPVILFPGETPWLLDEFRDQTWVDVFGCPVVTELTDDALKYAFAGPFTKEWLKAPARPLISFLPPENGIAPQSKRRFSADDVRKAAYWSLLLAPPAGVSYTGFGIPAWEGVEGAEKAESRKQRAETGGQKAADFPLWHKALFMPAGKQMTRLAKFMGTNDFWRLEPQPKAVGAQPGAASPQRYIAAAASETKNWSLVYVPEDRTLEVFLEALPASPSVAWFNPRTGQNSPAVAVVGVQTCQFPTPDPGDWLLVMKAGK